MWNSPSRPVVEWIGGATDPRDREGVTLLVGFVIGTVIRLRMERSQRDSVPSC